MQTEVEAGCISWALSNLPFHAPMYPPFAADRLGKWIQSVNVIVERHHLNVTRNFNSKLDVNIDTRKLPAFLAPFVTSAGFVTPLLSAGGPLLLFEQAIINEIKPRAPQDFGASDNKSIKEYEQGITHVWFKTIFDSLYKLPYFFEQKLDFTSSISLNRCNLNRGFLSRTGMLHLQTIFESKQYHVEHPEEAALITVAWLIRFEEYNRALSIISQIFPYLHLVRFYPRPSEKQFKVDLRVSVSNSGKVCAALQQTQKARPPNHARTYTTMKIVIENLNPTYDALLSVIFINMPSSTT